MIICRLIEHYEKKGVLQLGLLLNFELQWPFTTHYISTQMSVLRQVAWVVKYAIHCIYDFNVMQFIAI